jgi:hypothetical protein
VEQTARKRLGINTIPSDLLDRLHDFVLQLESGSDFELRNAYETQLGKGADNRDEALCSIALCLDEARRRGLDISHWPGSTLCVPSGVSGPSATDPVTEQDD